MNTRATMSCGPCNQDCNQGRRCPARLSRTTTPTERLDMNATLLAIKDALPKGSRLSACGTIAVITLGDDIPDPADLDAGVRFLRAMKRIKEKRV